MKKSVCILADRRFIVTGVNRTDVYISETMTEIRLILKDIKYYIPLLADSKYHGFDSQFLILVAIYCRIKSNSRTCFKHKNHIDQIGTSDIHIMRVQISDRLSK